jgi:hypothetical protein
VIKQRPEADTYAALGSTVTITLAI